MVKNRTMLRSKYFYLLILILLAVFWIWWLPGPRAANDFSYISRDFLKIQFDIPRVWNERGAEGLGEYGIFILWSYPINFIFGVLAILGLNFEVWERILVLLFIFLGSISIWQLLSRYKLSDKSKFIGSSFYLLNTYPILLIDGGQLSISLAYSLFPLAILKILEAVSFGVRKKILAGLVISVLGFFDIRFLYVLFLFLLLRILFDILEGKNQRLNILWRWSSTGLLAGLVVIALNAFWLIVIAKIPLEKNVLSALIKISANLFNIGHPVLMISPHWYKNVFGLISELKPEFILFPILVCLAPILRRKNKTVLFWLTVAIFSIFLTKGATEPLSFIYSWLYSNIPGFSFFRDSTKFFFLLALSYTVLISITAEEIFIRLKKKLRFVYILFIIAYLLYLIRPLYLGQMTGTFSIQPAESDFRLLANILKEDQGFGRVFWIPTTAPLSYSDLNHPIVEAARVFNRLPFAYGVKGAYEIFNFLREAPYMGEIFDVSAISYIAYPYPDIRRDRLSTDDAKYYSTFLHQLTNLPWIDKKIPESNIPLLKTKSNQDKIFITKNTWIVFGSDEVFKEATKSAELKLSNNAVIFAEYKSEIGPLINNYPEAKIVLNKKTITDILASFIPKSQFIFPSAQMSIIPDIAGWWKNTGEDLISWNDFLQSKYGINNKDFDLGGGWAVGERSLEFKVKSEKFKKGEVLLARVIESSRSGLLKFNQGDQIIGEIITKIDGDANVRWFEVGPLQKTADLIIKTNGDINVINALAVVNKQDLLVYKNKTERLLKNVRDFKPGNLEDSAARVSYQKINQTKYKVIVSGLTHPQIIVFSSSFHPLWKLNEEEAIQVYGFLNGFRVNKDGEYILEFEPQKYVETGLAISILSCISILFYLLWFHKNEKI